MSTSILILLILIILILSISSLSLHYIFKTCLKKTEKKLNEVTEENEKLKRDIHFIKNNSVLLRRYEEYTITDEMKNKFPALKKFDSIISYLGTINMISSNSKNPSIKHLFVDSKDELFTLSSHIIDKVSDD